MRKIILAGLFFDIKNPASSKQRMITNITKTTSAPSPLIRISLSANICLYGIIFVRPHKIPLTNQHSKLKNRLTIKRPFNIFFIQYNCCSITQMGCNIFYRNIWTNIIPCCGNRLNNQTMSSLYPLQTPLAIYLLQKFINYWTN